MWAWALLPVLLAVAGTLGIWVVFGIAVSNGTVNLTVEFPYISTCGSYNPQSCLFAQIINLCAVLVVWIVVLRFQQIRDYGHKSKVNVASVVLGFISALGISFVGNFQQTVVMGAHLFGAFLAFYVGVIYFWLQLWLTYKVEPSQDRCWVGPLRAIFCTVCTVLIVVMSILHNNHLRSAAAICEWLAVMSFFMLFGLFAAEFRHIDCHRLTVQTQTKAGKPRENGGGFEIAGTA
ncbi:modulator of macroautophagy TMEM150B [Scleropages formosus]|uniref:modulator of macroautophagy TMEM150B n=1 Tax=Scleropages formosus TaxID=113540 RepID=UPI000878E3CE|nr:modulator of macroautophagy TMEM150B-like [Scleropages formosus]